MCVYACFQMDKTVCLLFCCVSACMYLCIFTYLGTATTGTTCFSHHCFVYSNNLFFSVLQKCPNHWLPFLSHFTCLFLMSNDRHCHLPLHHTPHMASLSFTSIHFTHSDWIPHIESTLSSFAQCFVVKCVIYVPVKSILYTHVHTCFLIYTCISPSLFMQRWLRSADVRILRQLVAVHEGIEAMRWLMEERGALASHGSSLTGSLSSLVTVEEQGPSMSPCRYSTVFSGWCTGTCAQSNTKYDQNLALTY